MVVEWRGILKVTTCLVNWIRSIDGKHQAEILLRVYETNTISKVLN